MGLIEFGLEIARGVLEIVQGATGSRGVAIALGIVGTIGAAFGNLGGEQGPRGALGGEALAAPREAVAAAPLAGPVQGALPGGQG